MDCEWRTSRESSSFRDRSPNLENPKRFAAFVDALFQKDWVVYAKPAFGGPTQVLRYLGRYTHRVAISNHRLLAFDGESVTFRWKDYAHGNKQRKMTLSASEFLRRFTQHILPRGFVRIRQFGYLAKHASLGPTRPRTATPCRRARTNRAIGARHRRHLHLPMSSLQWRNADWPKSVRPAIGFPVQVSGQFVDHGIRRGPITCPRARAHSCLCGTRDSLPPRSPSVLNAFSSAPRPLWTLPTRHFLPLSVSTYLHGRCQNPKNTLVAP